MGQRMIRFSDLSNTLIDDDAEVVRVVVEKHPALTDGAVELEVLVDEGKKILKSALNVVSLKVYKNGEPETVTMEIEAFNALATDMNIVDVLRRAEPAYAPRKKVTPPPTPASEKVDYSSLEHAGKPHRGKTTDAEKNTVRENLDAINERLKRDGMRTIDLSDAQTVERYGLEELAKEAGHFAQ
jgi:hypothetical protein